MSSATGVVVALVGECHPAEAVAVASRWIPRGWDLRASNTTWGTALIAGPSVLVTDNRVVIGVAVADPWGVPGAPLDRHVLLERFALYGDQAAQLAAGPFALANLERATIIAALNGIVPVFLGRGARVVVGTHREMVAALAGSSSPVPVPPGSSASIDGQIANIACFGVWESLPRMRVAALEAEIEHHIRGAGSPRQVRRGSFADGFGHLPVRWIGSALVASPRLRSMRTARNARAELQAIRRQVRELWWQASLRSAPLFVPALERPALDSLTLGLRIS